MSGPVSHCPLSVSALWLNVSPLDFFLLTPHCIIKAEGVPVDLPPQQHVFPSAQLPSVETLYILLGPPRVHGSV